MDFIIKRAEMTECGDYYDYPCESYEVEVVDAEGNKRLLQGDCDHSAGCNGPHPYLVTWTEPTAYQGDIYCGYCAIKGAILNGSGFTLDFDPETTWEDDTIGGILSDLLWDAGYMNGHTAFDETEEYQTNKAKFHSGEWDEEELGPFWQWADANRFPFLVQAQVDLVKELKELADAKIVEMDGMVGEEGTKDPHVSREQYKALSAAFQEMIDVSKDLKPISRVEVAMDMLKRAGWEEV
jgi:hypothetical protein